MADSAEQSGGKMDETRRLRRIIIGLLFIIAALLWCILVAVKTSPTVDNIVDRVEKTSVRYENNNCTVSYNLKKKDIGMYDPTKALGPVLYIVLPTPAVTGICGEEDLKEAELMLKRNLDFNFRDVFLTYDWFQAAIR